VLTQEARPLQIWIDLLGPDADDLVSADSLRKLAEAHVADSDLPARHREVRRMMLGLPPPRKAGR
jgi:hypothetical protein